MLQSFEKREKVDDINTGKERRKDSNPLGRDTDPRGIWPAPCGLRSALFTDITKLSTYQHLFQPWNNASKFPKVELQKNYFWDAKHSLNTKKTKKKEK